MVANEKDKNEKNHPKRDLLYGIEEVGVLSTDIPGQLQRKCYPVRQHGNNDKENRYSGLVATDGTADSSSYRGLNAINKSDINLRIDTKGIITPDPFSNARALLVFSDFLEPDMAGGKPYHKDPRGVAKRAEEFLRSTGIGDVAYFSPELEFFIFDKARVIAEPQRHELIFESAESPSSGDFYAIANKRGYFPVGPWDKTHDTRAAILKHLEAMGIECEAHHHEVATAGQAEVNMKYDSLVRAADKTQLYKYVARMTAAAEGKVAVFLPKPLPNDNGSGMHVNMSIFKNGNNVLAGSGYAGLSQEGLYAIGGVLKHLSALSGLANPTTNSSRRFAKGFEAPIKAVYSARNRSAAVRIPVYHDNPKTKRLEARFPDPTANPYLLYPALLLAMVDGINNKIEPGTPLDHDVYELSADELAALPSVPRSLDARLEALDRDRAFLLEGGVFNNETIDSFLHVASDYASEVEKWTSPREMQVYSGWN